MGLGVLLISTIPPTIMAEQEPVNNNFDENQSIKIGNKTYMTIKQVMAFLVFYTALQSNIDFNIAVRMAYEQLR